MTTDNKPSMNQQDHSHREGQQNNTPPQGQGAGHRASQNNTQELSDMGNANEGQSDRNQKEQEAQQGERQP